MWWTERAWTGFETLAVGLLVLLLVPSPALAGTASTGSGDETPPAWYETGLDTMLDRLYDDEVGAILETAKPIDHGDRWAWTGDNGKALGAIAESPRRDEPRARAMADFLATMSEGPIVFQRWTDTTTSTVVDREGPHFEVSNHLITLEGNLTTGRIDAEIEYHDGRDKVFVTFGSAHVRQDGRWYDLAAFREDAGLAMAEGNRSVTVWTEYGFADTRIWENFTLDASPRVRHTVETEDGSGLGGIRLEHPDARIRRPEIPYEPRSYTHRYTPSTGLDETAEVDPLVNASASPSWAMYLEPARQDEFATGLAVNFHEASRLAEVQATEPHPFRGSEGTPRLGAANLHHTYEFADEPPTTVTEDLVLLDGVLTRSLPAYEAVATNVTAPRYEGIDASLLYEAGDTALGLVAYANATGRAGLVDVAVRWIDGYLAHHDRGTQTRSLAASALTAIRLADLREDRDWLATAENLVRTLHTYQIDNASHTADGAVLNQPDGGPFFDSTVVAARAFAEIAEVTGNATYDRWAQRAWSSFETGGETIRLGSTAATDTNHWSYKDGLTLLAAPHVPDDLRWAARNHLWTVIRDLAAYSVHTSEYTDETNSETQAWALEGLLRDRASWDGPWIVDSETTLSPVAAGGDEHVLEPEDTPAWVWVERGWIPHTDGVPPERTPGPHDTVRYTAEGPLAFLPAHTYELEPGWNAIGFPDLGHPVEPERLLGHLPVTVAWGYDAGEGGFESHVPGSPGVSTLEAIQPGQGLFVHLRESARIDVAHVPDGNRPAGEGLGLVALDANATPHEAERAPREPDGVLGRRASEAGEAGPRVRWLGNGTLPGAPPTLVHGTLTQASQPVRGEPVRIVVEDRVVAETTTSPEGEFELRVPADAAAHRGHLRVPGLEPNAPAKPVALDPGAAVEVSMDTASRRSAVAHPPSPWTQGLLVAAIVSAAVGLIAVGLRGPQGPSGDGRRDR